MHKNISIDCTKLLAIMLIVTLHNEAVVWREKGRMLFAAPYSTDTSSIPFDQMTIILQAFTVSCCHFI